MLLVIGHISYLPYGDQALLGPDMWLFSGNNSLKMQPVTGLAQKVFINTAKVAIITHELKSKSLYCVYITEHFPCSPLSLHNADDSHTQPRLTV